ncbi:MAG TPA: hypothetical protein DGT23_26920 [Micromonosporaceae bacterium]|nr:hypothetical protein [Micromonosporaceae bacterium]
MLKGHLRELARQTITSADDDRSYIECGVHRTAHYHPARDDEVVALESFTPAVASLAAFSDFVAVAQPSDAHRVVLQFVYDCLERHHAPRFDIAAFDLTWTSFVDELSTPYWRFLSVCQLENFVSDVQLADLVDGVSIHDRSTYGFKEHGWSDFQVKKLYEEIGYASTYILVAEDKLPKSPENLYFSSTTEPVIKSHRMLRALRLAKEGDVHIGGDTMIGRVFTNRPAGSGFSSSGGASAHGTSPRWPGPGYFLSTSDVAHVATLYSQLTAIGAMQGRGPFNLDLALRSFFSSYDRIPEMPDTRLVDLVTAAEALLGTENEIIFRLSFRIAALLGSTDSERVAIFTDMRAFYDTRSRVAHGAPLKPKHQARLENYSVLRGYVRRLLTAFLHLATSPARRTYGTKFFTEQLDIVLQHEQQRAALRMSMGLIDPETLTVVREGVGWPEYGHPKAPNAY